MRNYSKTVGALAAASTLVAGYASAELEGEVHVGYSNMYEFRFIDVGTDLAEAGVDLAYATGPVSLSAGLWYGSWNDDQPAVGSGDELDLYAGVGTDFGPVSLELGYIYYYFPNASPFSPSNTQEIYLSAGVDLFWGIGAGATYFYDFDEFNGAYMNFEVTKSFAFSECLGLDLASGVAWADGHGLQRSTSVVFGNPGDTNDGYQGWYISAQLPWEFRDGVTLTPYAKYTDASSGLITDVPATGSSAGDNYFVAGIKLAVAF